MDDMQEVKGYVRMHRKIIEHSIWHNKEPEYLFLFLLLIARVYYSGPKRGTLTASAQTLADLMPAHFGVNRDRIRTMLSNLSKWAMIRCTSSRAGFSIRVTNFDKYQADAWKIEATQRKIREKTLQTRSDKSKGGAAPRNFAPEPTAKSEPEGSEGGRLDSYDPFEDPEQPETKKPRENLASN